MLLLLHHRHWQGCGNIARMLHVLWPPGKLVAHRHLLLLHRCPHQLLLLLLLRLLCRSPGQSLLLLLLVRCCSCQLLLLLLLHRCLRQSYLAYLNQDVAAVSKLHAAAAAAAVQPLTITSAAASSSATCTWTCCSLSGPACQVAG